MKISPIVIIAALSAAATVGASETNGVRLKLAERIKQREQFDKDEWPAVQAKNPQNYTLNSTPITTLSIYAVVNRFVALAMELDLLKPKYLEYYKYMESTKHRKEMLFCADLNDMTCNNTAENKPWKCATKGKVYPKEAVVAAIIEMQEYKELLERVLNTYAPSEHVIQRPILLTKTTQQLEATLHARSRSVGHRSSHHEAVSSADQELNELVRRAMSLKVFNRLGFDEYRAEAHLKSLGAEELQRMIEKEPQCLELVDQIEMLQSQNPEVHFDLKENWQSKTFDDLSDIYKAATLKVNDAEEQKQRNDQALAEKTQLLEKKIAEANLILAPLGLNVQDEYTSKLQSMKVDEAILDIGGEVYIYKKKIDLINKIAEQEEIILATKVSLTRLASTHFHKTIYLLNEIFNSNLEIFKKMKMLLIGIDEMAAELHTSVKTENLSHAQIQQMHSDMKVQVAAYRALCDLYAQQSFLLDSATSQDEYLETAKDMTMYQLEVAYEALQRKLEQKGLEDELLRIEIAHQMGLHDGTVDDKKIRIAPTTLALQKLLELETELAIERKEMAELRLKVRDTMQLNNGTVDEHKIEGATSIAALQELLERETELANERKEMAELQRKLAQLRNKVKIAMLSHGGTIDNHEVIDSCTDESQLENMLGLAEIDASKRKEDAARVDLEQKRSDKLADYIKTHAKEKESDVKVKIDQMNDGDLDELDMGDSLVDPTYRKRMALHKEYMNANVGADADLVLDKVYELDESNLNVENLEALMTVDMIVALKSELRKTLSDKSFPSDEIEKVIAAYQTDLSGAIAKAKAINPMTVEEIKTKRDKIAGDLMMSEEVGAEKTANAETTANEINVLDLDAAEQSAAAKAAANNFNRPNDPVRPAADHGAGVRSAASLAISAVLAAAVLVLA